MSSSVVIAQEHTLELGDMFAPTGGWKDKVSAVYKGLTAKDFPHRLNDLTWSRVKKWMYGEARRVNYEEVVALKELKALEEARRAKQKLAATANLLAAHLAKEGAPLDSRQLRALRRLAGPLDRARAGGDAR